MQTYVPEVAWHDRESILSLDVQQKAIAEADGKVPMAVEADGKIPMAVEDERALVYKMVTGSVQTEVRVWEFSFDRPYQKEGVKPGLSVRFIANLTGHTRPIDVVRFSPNGSLIASGDADGAILIWKIKPLEAQLSECLVNGESEKERSLDKSEDIPPNRENWVRALNSSFRHDKEVTNVCFSPDSLMLASVSMDDSVLLHRVDTGKRIWSVRGFRRFPNGIAWDPRGKYIVTMSTDRRLDILDVNKGTRLRCCHKIELPETILNTGSIISQQSYKMFHDDQLGSFTRVVDFSPCGSLVFAPATHLEVGENNIYGTCIFKRADFNLCRPSALLISRKPTFAVKCSPIVYELRKDVTENFLGLPYRIVFAVLSKGAVFFYDSQYSKPFSYIDNILTRDLTSMAWTPNGNVLVISSLEGYNCFINIDPTELGEICDEQPPLSRIQSSVKVESADGEVKLEIVYPDSPRIAPVKKTPKPKKDASIIVKKEAAATPTSTIKAPCAAAETPSSVTKKEEMEINVLTPSQVRKKKPAAATPNSTSQKKLDQLW